MKVAISIINYNSEKYLLALLDELSLQKTKHQLEIWVVDNASPDNGANLVEKKFPKINLIRSKENGGFAKGHNLVLQRVKADLVIMLNPDIDFKDKQAIDKLIKFMDEHPDCGISSCKLVSSDGRLQSNGGDLPFGISLLVWLYNLEFFGNVPNFHRTDKNYYDQVREVGWVGGTVMVIKSEVLKKVGLLNEDIFMYFEDTEFCYQAHQQGFKVMINPSVVAEHVSGASSNDPKLKQWTGEYKGLIYFYNKYFGAMSAFLIKLLIFKVTLLRIIAFFVLGKFSYSKTYIKVLQAI